MKATSRNMEQIKQLQSLDLDGYRPFRHFTAHLGMLEVIVGANGSGKTALFEFLRFLRDSVTNDIPPEIIPGGAGQAVFSLPGTEQFDWNLLIKTTSDLSVNYRGTLIGPVGRPRTANETITVTPAVPPILELRENIVYVREPDTNLQRTVGLPKANQLMLKNISDPTMPTSFGLRTYIQDWRFYGAFEIDKLKTRRGSLVAQKPTLREDAANLSSVLHYLFTEHREQFEALEQFLAATVPGFRHLSVKAQGAPGEVIASWQETGSDELTIADLSDGTIRLLCWATLCHQPQLPPLICLDEPDSGLHPRTLPVLAGLFKKISAHTQLLMATHSSFLLTQFEREQIAIMRKASNGVQFVKPADVRTLVAVLDDFGPQEIEIMHRSDELELLS